MRSRSRPGVALRCSTRAPCCTGSVQARTPGAPSTATRQFGQWPPQHISPRRRWYLKLRENVRRPAAYSAEPIVSPSSAATGLPSNVNVTLRSRSTARRVASVGDSWFCSSPELAGSADAQHLVGPRVAVGLEPRPAARAVIPPLALDARNVAAEVVVLRQLAQRWLRAGAGGHFSPESKIGDLADAAMSDTPARTTCRAHARPT